MNLVKVLEPYASELQQFMEVNGRISPETLRAIKPIYEDYWQTHNYIGVREMKLNCSGCIYDCCKALWNTYKQMTNNRVVNFKGVPEKKEPTKPLQPLQPIKTEVINLSEDKPKVDWSEKTWPEIKEEAKRLGIKIHGKKQAQLIKEINSKS